MEGVAKFFQKNEKTRGSCRKIPREKIESAQNQPRKKKANPHWDSPRKKYYENNKKTYASASAMPPIGGAIISPSGFGSAALTSACASSAFLRYSSGSVGVNSPLAIL